ncbi:type IA DNA topoisomerase [Desulfotomaculum copahuensis]|uniref:DNA topoisomerase n=1 Tax=Desulfotomaculum copahuensis TaxID=1838280 RepID=A0A1B7LFS3_9FIRM|nr:type IA DNA topoisomerase [Desulfotomaculum copahuensis]OAT83487.1 DNA topoisomerase III [Desulfotomaculum copahuensis]
MRTLVITEKPSVARDIANVLGRFDKRDGYLQNGKYIVSWAFGHLTQLAEPHEYDPVLKKWNLVALPIIPERFKLVPTKDGKKQLDVLKKLLHSSNIDTVIDACDSGREGELIFRRIYGISGCKKPVKRLWLSEATPAAVKGAFGKLRDGRELDNLARAAEARSQADWLVGINATRAFTCRHKELLSVGRVQTPTLALVVAREKEIRAFQSQPYWEIWATFRKETGETYRGKWTRGETDRLPGQEEAAAIARKIGLAGNVARVEQKETKEQSPTLFNLNDLQKEANKKHGLTAQQALDAAQALYEKHKLLTYPRTDSRHLTAAIVRDTLKDRLAALAAAPEYTGLVPEKPPALGKRYVDDTKVSDHHAVIPTAVKPDLAALGKNERLVYDLVARRFLAIFYPDARYAVTKVTTTADGETFISKGRVELDPGWKAVYKHDDREDKNGENQQLPVLNEGEAVAVQKVETPEKQTKPPARYTEATLLAAMENAGRLVDDKDMADTLKSAGGIGTPATRASIIERLIHVGYITREKKTLVPTRKGETLIDLVPEQVKSPEMTARWEQGLLEIERGAMEVTRWLGGIKEFTREVVQMAKEQEASGGVKQQKEVLGKCPLCGREVVEFTKSYGCTGYKEGCKFAVWKEIAGKKITVHQTKELLHKGKTGVLKGFKSKTGKGFDAALVLGEGGKVNFEFADHTAQTLGKCPLCGKEVIEGKKGYGCAGWKEGCKFVVWKEIAGKKITVNQAKELLQKGKTAVLKGFKSRAGKEFDAALVLGEGGKVEFEFEKRGEK